MVLARFLPQNEHFFDYFRNAVKNASETAKALRDLLDNYSDVERKVRLVRDLEHQGDEITHQIFDALHRTFVTPLDRDDIANLAVRIDDFVDAIEEAARRFWIYRIDEPTDKARQLARIIDEQAALLADAIILLENNKRWDRLLHDLINIHTLENEADTILDHALTELYKDSNEIPEIIKSIRWGELYQLMENATDCAEYIANTLKGIVVKNV